MATKAELVSELADLKHEMMQRSEETNKDEPTKETSKSEPASSEKSDLQQLLLSHGVDAETVEALGENLSDEIKSLQKEKPLFVLVVAFALGLLVGRASK
jgi:phage regulator Rha-like protein